jgi:two-component system, cell cycle sensor histidine kinase and response regulator CckA
MNRQNKANAATPPSRSDALGAATEELLTWFSLSEEALWITGGEGEVREANEAFRRFFPHATENGLSWTGLFSASDADTLRRLKSTGGRTKLKLASSPAGRWIEVICTPLCAGSAGWVARDITEEINAAQALMVSESRLRDLLEASRDWVWETDERLTFTFSNHRVREILGFSPEEIIGSSPLDLMALNDSVKALPMFEELLRRHIPFTLQGQNYQHKNGTEVILESNVAPIIGMDGEFGGFRGIGRDVTERTLHEETLRKSEKKYRDLVENAKDVIFTLNGEGRFTSMNPSFEAITGWQASEWLGRPFYQLLETDQVPRACARFESVMTGGRHPAEEFLVRARSGESIPAEVSSAPLLEDGKIAGVLGVARDVRERKKMEAQWQHAQKMETVGQVAGGIAHDFNNLLTVIRGFNELLQLDFPRDHPAYKKSQAIADASQRAITLTRQLLTFSRKEDPRPVVFNLNDLVCGTVPLLHPVMGETCKIETFLHPSPLSVRADPRHIEQVILNLALNARDAMTMRGKLRLSTQLPSDPVTLGFDFPLPADEFFFLQVQDNGKGMTEEVRSRAFEPFFTTKPHGKGTGLGLATSYGIVRQSGGHIALTSTPGAGTTITIALPRAKSSNSLRQAPARDALMPTGVETVLLVEDEPSVRQLAHTILSRLGYTVVEGRNGTDGLHHWAKRAPKPDLILTDVVMPELGGVQMVQRIRAEDPNVRVLFMSGYSDQANELERDANEAFLPKPFTAQALAKAVRGHLDGTF